MITKSNFLEKLKINRGSILIKYLTKETRKKLNLDFITSEIYQIEKIGEGTTLEGSPRFANVGDLVLTKSMYGALTSISVDGVKYYITAPSIIVGIIPR